MRIVDEDGKVFGFLAGRPTNDPTWDTNADTLNTLLEEITREFGKLGKNSKDRRGSFSRFRWGVSYGGGQKAGIPVRANQGIEYSSSLLDAPLLSEFAKGSSSLREVNPNIANPTGGSGFGFGGGFADTLGPEAHAHNIHDEDSIPLLKKSRSASARQPKESAPGRFISTSTKLIGSVPPFITSCSTPAGRW